MNCTNGFSEICTLVSSYIFVTLRSKMSDFDSVKTIMQDESYSVFRFETELYVSRTLYNILHFKKHEQN